MIYGRENDWAPSLDLSKSFINFLLIRKFGDIQEILYILITWVWAWPGTNSERLRWTWNKFRSVYWSKYTWGYLALEYYKSRGYYFRSYFCLYTIQYHFEFNFDTLKYLQFDAHALENHKDIKLTRWVDLNHFQDHQSLRFDSRPRPKPNDQDIYFFRISQIFGMSKKLPGFIKLPTGLTIFTAIDKK